MPTIKQISEELEMTKQGVRKYLATLPQEYLSKDDNGTIHITQDGVEQIKKQVFANKKPVTSVVTEPVTSVVTEPVTSDLIKMLEKELDTKNSLIDKQGRLLEQAQKSIQDLTLALSSAQISAQQAQALHAGTMQKQLQESDPEKEEVEVIEEKPSFWQRVFNKK